MNLRNLILCWAWVWLTPSVATALSSDRDQPIHIEADSVTIDDRSGLSTYQGNVELRQGSMHLSAQRITVFGLRSPTKIVAEGDPVRFRQRPDGKGQDARGEASRLEYLTDQNKLMLLGKAKLSQGDNVFQSHRIEYDVSRARVRAGEKSPGSERVRVTLQPSKRPTEDPPDP